MSILLVRVLAYNISKAALDQLTRWGLSTAFYLLMFRVPIRPTLVLIPTYDRQCHTSNIGRKKTRLSYFGNARFLAGPLKQLLFLSYVKIPNDL